jgi:DNA ligase D-like protein (predicted 3'-phosphoesterase)
MTKSKFIVVEHHATKARLHWDLRFRIPGSRNWMSFAVRKGVPLKPGQKVLAVRTHDHSEKEALFIGKIPEGEYGAGVLKKWDSGPCIIHKLKPGSMLIEFKGNKVKGFYYLISTGVMDRREYKRKQYMLFKGKVLNEIMGMVSRHSTRGESEDQEEGVYDQPGKKLPWDKRRHTI